MDELEYMIIDVPNLNDSLSPLTLNSKSYFIRFTYNDTMDYWTFGLYNELEEPIVQGIKIVPRAVLTLFFGARKVLGGFFFCISNLDRIGRNDFADGKATFAYISEDQYV